jgi:hypothetical protein
MDAVGIERIEEERGGGWSYSTPGATVSRVLQYLRVLFMRERRRTGG